MTALEEIKSPIEAEIERVVQSVNEWDDRTSPDDYPEHLLITSDELADILRNFADVTLESLQRDNERLRQFLFPYADRTDISGISWDGKYLIGDKESISAFREMQNRGLQIDVYKRAYDQKEAALKARAEAAEAEVKRLRLDLSFYACDETNCTCDAGEEDVTNVSCGFRARTALASTGGEHHAD